MTPFHGVIHKTLRNSFAHPSWYGWLQKLNQRKLFFFHQLTFRKKIITRSIIIVYKLLLNSSSLPLSSSIIFHGQYSKLTVWNRYLKINFKLLVNITSLFVLIINEYSWFHACYELFLFKYVGYSYIVPENYMFLSKVSHIKEPMICSYLYLFLVKHYR